MIVACISRRRLDDQRQTLGILDERRIAVRKTAFRAPNTNTYVERIIQTIQHECLDHFVISASATSIFLVSEWLEHYHQERPQHALDNEPLNKSKLRGRPAKQMGPIGRQTLPLSYLRFMQQLGGLLKKLQPTGGVKFRPSMLADDAIRPALIRGIRQFGTAVALPPVQNPPRTRSLFAIWRKSKSQFDLLSFESFSMSPTSATFLELFAVWLTEIENSRAL